MAHPLKVGVGRVDVTPPAGVATHVGTFSHGAGDRLHAKALLFDDGVERAAIVTVDVIVLGSETVEAARRRIAELTGIKGGNVMFGASHTHSGPATMGWLAENYSEAYVAELAEMMAGAVYEAELNKREALIGAGRGEARISINRWVMTPEGAKWGANPEGPVDNEVTVLRVDDLNRRPFALLVNYAAHASVRSFAKDSIISGDYPSYLQSLVEKVYDGRVTALFSNGASGDTKIAFLTDDGKQFRYGDLDDARRYGTIIGCEAVKVAETIETKPLTGLYVSSKVVPLPLSPLPSIEAVEAELAKSREALKEAETKGVEKGARFDLIWNLKWAEKTLAQLRERTAPTSIPGEVQVIQLGDWIAFIAVPGELFVEVGLKLKELVNKPAAFIVGYANGYVGYLPSAKSQREDEDRGKLRYYWHKFVNYGYPSTFSEEVEGVLLETVKSLIR